MMKKFDITKSYKQVIKKTAEVIKNGGMVLFPSDTVYILAVDPTSKRAVEKLIGFKNRWVGKAISVAVSDKKMAEKFVKMTENSETIYNNLLPGPFTVVSEGLHKMSIGIEAEDGSLGVRIPDNKYIFDLVEELEGPITATSANLSGRSPHYSVESFWKSLSEKKKAMIDLVVDAGKLPINKPSTVIDARESEIKILRRGDLITGSAKQTLISKSEKETGKIAEFLLKKILKRVWDDKVNKPLVFGLSGDLGTGKTVFSRRMAGVLGIKDKITSPTFVIYNEYQIPLNPTLTRGKLALQATKFLHMDLYRLSNEYEFEEIKFFEQFVSLTSSRLVACIEWPENMGKENFEKLKKMTNYVSINFEYVDENTREIGYLII
jgi:L-threonylcarbamoyladenylate synthase